MTKYKKLKGEDLSGRNFFPKGKKKECENNEIRELASKYNEVDTSEITSFEEMPLSARTLKGLSANNFTSPTEIQRESIIFALRGRDVLGAAKTGSGKTLAFLIPIMEILYCRKWTNFDGVGAIIITPTRELALQIYETLVKVGKFHEFSAGLIIGGKDLHFEKNRMHNVNILICTPGRLLQHMDENPLFTCLNMQILVLDEADRCLDMGFQKEMNSIIENLPSTRQTLLFSATQTKNVKDLARLSLVDPEYVSVHEHEKFKTPDGLTQSYMICEHHEKIPLLWSFIKAHSKQKIMIFLSTCNQVRYISEMFRKLRPRNPLFALQGKMHQMKRMDIYHAFCRKEHAVLFSTDIASRGLDFPNVDWVVQCDCPEDVDAYVHRVGRTARYTRAGESLLIISKSEQGIIEKLINNRIPISEIKVNPNQINSPQAKLELFIAKNSEMKECAQRAFVSYFKSVFLMKDKLIFDVKSIDAYKYARSLGLIDAPKVRFIQRMEKKKADDCSKNVDSKASKDFKQSKTKKTEKKIEEIQSTSKIEKDFNFLEGNSSDSEAEEFSFKQKAHDLVGGSLSITKRNKTTRAKLAKKLLKSNIVPNKKIIFNEDSEDEIGEKSTNARVTAGAGDCGGITIDEIRKRLQEEDMHDRKLYAEVSRNRKRERKMKEKGKKQEEEMSEDDASSDGSGPDLSWLPDPDRVYAEGKEPESESENFNGKRKLPSDFEDDSDEDSPLPIVDKEELALKLMSLNN